MASGPSGSISFPGVPDGAGDFVAFPGMGTLQEETEVDYLGEAPTVAETKWGIAKMLVPSLTEPSFDGVAKQLLSASPFKRDGGDQGPRWVQLRLANTAVSDGHDPIPWRAWPMPLSMSQVAQDLMSTTGITNS